MFAPHGSRHRNRSMNKIERVSAVLAGKQADVIPAGFWYHYDGSYTPDEMARAHLKTFRETGVDVYKIMQDYIQRIDCTVSVPGDWAHVRFPGRESPVYGKLCDVLKQILDETGHNALTFQTVFGPLKTAVQTFGYDLIMAHAKECPTEMAAAVSRIAEAQTEWIAGFLETGADGIFYAGQFSEPGRFSRELFETLAGKADLTVLNAAKNAGGKIILHICGEPEYRYESSPAWYTGYPGDIVNWSVKDTGLQLAEGRRLFSWRPILGGMNNRGNILKGSEEQILAEVDSMIASAGETAGFMLGADCTIQGETICNERIRKAVEAAHTYLERHAQ